MRGSVVCQNGFAYAAVSGYSIAFIIFERCGPLASDEPNGWTWAVDPYWKQFGERADLCRAMPAKIKTALGCG